ncbi:MAG: tyrosine-type recombinase/integrase [Sulfuricaulis sp.]
MTDALIPTIPSTRQALAHDVGCRGLDGHQGTNRCHTRVNQLGVNDDVAAVFAWIADRAASPKTARDFLSQARRLFWWALERCPNPESSCGVGKALSSLTRHDLTIYKEFLKKPDQNAIVQKKKHQKNPRKAPFLTADGTLHPDWRPFLGKLNAAHIEHVFLVLRNMFGYLVDVGYLDGNPLAGTRAKAKGSMGDHSQRVAKPTQRALDAEQWLAVLEAIEDLPKETDEARDYYERTLFMMQLFFHLGARIGEIATHQMKHFIVNENDWVWSVMGKGGKEAEVPVNDALLAALIRYRLHLGLTPLPYPGEKDTPLLLDYSHKKGIGERQIARLVKEIFARAAERLKTTHPTKAAQLAVASPHWIRHAMASFAAERAKDMREMLGIRDLLRHTDLKTTLGYIHVADQAKKMVSDWLADVANTGEAATRKKTSYPARKPTFRSANLR